MVSVEHRVRSTHINLLFAWRHYLITNTLKVLFGSLPSGVPKSGRALEFGVWLQIRARIVRPVTL